MSRRFTLNLNEGKMGIGLKTYPIIDSVEGGSVGERLGIETGSLIISLNDKKYDKRVDFIKQIKESKKSSPTVELLVLDDPQNYNFSALRFGKITLSPPTNVIDIDRVEQVNSITQWSKGSNKGTNGDTFTMNPIARGFAGLKGEVLFIPKGYKFYHGLTTSRGDFELHDGREIFVSDRKNALIYSQGSTDSKKLIRFKTKKPLVLFNILDPQNIRSILDTVESDTVLTQSDKKLFNDLVNNCVKSKSNLSHSIEGYVDELDDFVKVGLDTLKYNDVKYGSEGEIHRVSIAFYDMAIPTIPSFTKSNINDIFDGYYGDYTPNAKGFFHPEVYLLDQYECLELVGERSRSVEQSKVDEGVGFLRKKHPTHYHDNARTLLTKLRKKKKSRTKRKDKKNSKKKSKAKRKSKTKSKSYF